MHNKINDFGDKVSKYKKYVTKDKIDNLFNDIKTDSVKELTRIIANSEESVRSRSSSGSILEN